MCEGHGSLVKPWIHVDTSAAIGIAQRKGLGRVRHLSTQSLSIQDAVRDSLEKVDGSKNPADLFTKRVPAELIERHMEKLGLEPRQGRAETAPMLVKGREILELEIQDAGLDMCIDSLEEDCANDLEEDKCKQQEQQ